ncbi:MAG: hypothetical protein FWG21_05060 [Oscillospiraceae bacterium]|nr:hypothetical protein [Oscillospiraceae bacterium]
MEPTMADDSFYEEIREMCKQIQSLLKIGLVPLKEEVDYVITNHITDEKRLDNLLSDLVDFTQIKKGLVVFNRLCRYTFSFLPEITTYYIRAYYDMYHPDNEALDETRP